MEGGEAKKPLCGLVTGLPSRSRVASHAVSAKAEWTPTQEEAKKGHRDLLGSGEHRACRLHVTELKVFSEMP